MTRPRSGERTGTDLLLVLAFFVPAAVWGGWVGMTLWNWFVPVVFATAPRLGILTAIGIALVFNGFVGRGQEQDDRGTAYVLALGFGMGLLRLGVGWVIHALLGAMS